MRTCHVPRATRGLLLPAHVRPAAGPRLQAPRLGHDVLAARDVALGRQLRELAAAVGAGDAAGTAREGRGVYWGSRGLQQASYDQSKERGVRMAS